MKTITGGAFKAVTTLALATGAAFLIKRAFSIPINSLENSASLSGEDFSTDASNTEDRDDIALRAYYISERRRTAGLASDPHQDWIDAEKEIRSEMLNNR